MTRPWVVVPFSLFLLAAPLLAQTQIGGGTCNSSSLSGAYSVSITGRQVSAAGVFTNLFQANGSATFDGLNKATFSMTSDTLQAVGTPTTWTGTYSMQANCAGVITITTGGTITLNLVTYNQGNSFLVTGSDATYSYTGSGGNLPSGCSNSLLTGPYVYNATGSGFSGSTINGVVDGAGQLQFDGQGKMTANLNMSLGGTSNSTLTASGTYTVTSNCLGTGTLTDSTGNSYVLIMSATAGNTTATTDLTVSIAQASKFMITGGAHTVTGNTCSTSTMNGAYSLTLSGRAISSTGAFAGSFQGDGIVTFDGQGKVVLSGTANTNLALAKPLSYSGTYSLTSSCSGNVILATPTGANMTLLVWNTGKSFSITGGDATYVYSGSGSNVRPSACATATLSGEYVYDASGFTLAGTTQNGSEDESGVLQFDGQGNVTASYAVTSSGKSATYTATGTYAVQSNCLGTATLTDSSNVPNTMAFSVTNAYGQGVNVIASNSGFVRSGTAHAAFLNPTQSIGNVASYAVNATPPGSVFALFGQSLATKPAGATTTTLPTTLLNTTVTVNGELAPLFYVDPGQIDAQMPWDIPAGTVATVIVKNGTSTSNAAAVVIPATATPGLSVYSNNRAVVVNADGNINSASAGANVGDEVVAYFTGGGPVQAAGKLVTGSPAPNGLAPVTENTTVTVGTATATVKYIGLTPQSIGLYQVNFIVPQLAKGSYQLVVTIGGVASNGPLMTVAN